MEKQIFKVGDRVFHIDSGWGVIDDISNSKSDLHPIQVTFKEGVRYFTLDGRYYEASINKSLSLTEYTLQGFSQEKPIELPEVGELCLVRDFDDREWNLRKFSHYEPNDEYPYRLNNTGFKEMKRIKILD